MTPAPDTSRENVERVAERFAATAVGLCTEDPAKYMASMRVADALEAASLLRALLARCEVAEAERDAAKEMERDYQSAALGDNHHNAAMCPHCNPTLKAERDTAYARGFREGAEQMREAAAGRMHRIAENERATKPYAQNDDHVMRIEDTAFALDQHGRAIRALPLPEPQA
mgnify:FL=1